MAEATCAKWSSWFLAVYDGMHFVFCLYASINLQGYGGFVLFLVWRMLQLLKLQLMPMPWKLKRSRGANG